MRRSKIRMSMIVMAAAAAAVALAVPASASASVSTACPDVAHHENAAHDGRNGIGNNVLVVPTGSTVTAFG
jgi:hypothetical protein